MIFELRTYLLKPGTALEAESRFAKVLHHRTAFSPMAGLWHTEAGLLNQLIHLWPYESLDQRMAVRDATRASGNWPPALRDILLEMEARIIVPASFSPAVVPGRCGPLYELCIDSYLPSGPEDAAKGWAGALEERCRLSPLVFCGRTEIGPLNQWIHLWGYSDASHRERVQRELADSAAWPPKEGAAKLLRQERLLLSPALCSALQ